MRPKYALRKILKISPQLILISSCKIIVTQIIKEKSPAKADKWERKITEFYETNFLN